MTCFATFSILIQGLTGPRSAVGNVSGNRCESDCRPGGVASSIPTGSHTFVKIDYEIISTVIVLPSAESFKKDCCQLTSESMCMKYWLTALFKIAQEKSLVR